MQIKISPDKVVVGSRRMLELSRMTRLCGGEVEDVCRQLQQLSGLGECRSALMKQGDGVTLLAARLAGLSSALEEIAGAYSAAEDRSLYALEERPRPIASHERISVYGTSSDMHRRIQNILYK